MSIEETLMKDGPAWVIVGSLLSILWKMIKEVISVVKSNTSAVAKLTEIVSHCSKNREN